MYRQGDVLLVESHIPTARSRCIRRDRQGFPGVKGIVLAAGEATGHHHRVEARSARLHEAFGRRYLKVAKDGAQVVHEEHGTITIPPGEYEILRQREYEAPQERVRSASSRYVYD